MDRNAQDAARYRALSAWMRDGQPARKEDQMAGEMLGLVQHRRTWPIPQDTFDAAVDRALLPNAARKHSYAGGLKMQTLVERLRYQAESFRKQNCPGFLEDETADRLEAVEADLETAMTVLEQIATTPRNRGAKRSASATVAFLRTQLDSRHNVELTGSPQPYRGESSDRRERG